MKLQEGSYENVITNELHQEMMQAERDGLVCKHEEIDEAESPYMFAEHVNKVVLNRLSDENLSAQERRDFVNRLIELLDEGNEEDKIIDNRQMLSAVLSKQEEARLKATKQNCKSVKNSQFLANPLNNMRKSLEIWQKLYIFAR